MSEIQFILTIEENDADDEMLDETVRLLRNDLLELGVESAEKPLRGALPAGAKAIDFEVLNQIAIAVSPAALTGVIAFLQNKFGGNKTQTLKIKTPGGFEIEFPTDKKYTEEELLALIDKLSERDAPA